MMIDGQWPMTKFDCTYWQLVIGFRPFSVVNTQPPETQDEP